MFTNEEQALINQSLLITADQLEASGQYPPQPEPAYPTFPDALREVHEKQPDPKCPNCHVSGYFYPADKAYAPGHVYSEEGLAEFTRYSRYCEFCFDGLMREPEDEEQE